MVIGYYKYNCDIAQIGLFAIYIHWYLLVLIYIIVMKNSWWLKRQFPLRMSKSSIGINYPSDYWWCLKEQHTVTGSVGSSFSIDCPWWNRNITGGSLTGSTLIVMTSFVEVGVISGSGCSSYIVKLTYCIPEQSWQGMYTKLEYKRRNV